MNNKNGYKLLKAAYFGQLEVVQNLISQGTNPRR